MTTHEYLEIERAAQFKSEFYRGEMFATSGGSPTHSRLAVWLASLCERHPERRECHVDSRLLVETDQLYTYPDIPVVSGQVALAHGRSDVFVNPILLVEVLSPSTEQYDRGVKTKVYRSIPSLLECVLVAQDRAEVEVYRRQADETWNISVAKGNDVSVELTSIGYTLQLRELYRGILT